MQRMGYLILSFLILALLKQIFPRNPVWTVYEPHFFSELFAFSPKTIFFPPQAETKLKTVTFHSVINLSHRNDAARIAGSVQSSQRFGAYVQDNCPYILGYWVLDRARIVKNNRYNQFNGSKLLLPDDLLSSHLTQIQSQYTTTPRHYRIDIVIDHSEAQ